MKNEESKEYLFFVFFLTIPKFASKISILSKGPNCNQLQNLSSQLQKIIKRIMKHKYAKSERLYSN